MVVWEEKELAKLGRAGLIELADREFGVGFNRYCGADKMLAEIMRQHKAKEARKAAKKPGRPKGS